jgi:hypothetical protein
VCELRHIPDFYRRSRGYWGDSGSFLLLPQIDRLLTGGSRGREIEQDFDKPAQESNIAANSWTRKLRASQSIEDSQL